MKHEYDLIVIGSGSSGWAAATQAKKLGVKKILLVEKRKLGYSLCTNEGCMPSKTLIASAHAKHVIEQAKKLGLKTSKPKVDWNAIQRRVERIVASDFFGARTTMIKKSGIPVAKGSARFVSKHAIEVRGKTYSAKKFVIATGSDTFMPPIDGLDSVEVLDSGKALYLKKLPKSLIIVGGGYISVELGSLFNAMGVKVTILDRGAHILSRLDADIGPQLQTYMQEDGIAIINNAIVDRIRKKSGKKIVHAKTSKGGKIIRAEEIMIAAGRVPATKGMSLEAAGVTLGKRGEVEVDACMQSSSKHIYAVGDVNGRVPLVYVGSMEGRTASENMFGKKRKRMDYRCAGNIIFSNPEIGTAGMTEAEAREAGYKIAVATTPYTDIGKAIAMGQTRGFVKLIAEKGTGRMLGLHMIGEAATDLMQVILPHLYHEDTVFDVMDIPYPHPSMGEAFAYPAEELASKLD